MQAQQSAALHAKQAKQAREEAEAVRCQAADSVRKNSITWEQTRELDMLRQRVAAAEQQAAEHAAELERWTSGAKSSAGKHPSAAFRS